MANISEGGDMGPLRISFFCHGPRYLSNLISQKGGIGVIGPILNSSPHFIESNTFIKLKDNSLELKYPEIATDYRQQTSENAKHAKCFSIEQ